MISTKMNISLKDKVILYLPANLKTLRLKILINIVRKNMRWPSFMDMNLIIATGKRLAKIRFPQIQMLYMKELWATIPLISIKRKIHNLSNISNMLVKSLAFSMFKSSFTQNLSISYYAKKEFNNFSSKTTSFW